jgi:hypothetical protein
MFNKRWADFLYKRIGLESDPCIYCGSPSEHWDHIPPIHFVTRLLQLDIDPGKVLKEVRACEECNLVLGGNILTTIRERKKFLLDYYFRNNFSKALRIKSKKLKIKKELRLIMKECKKCKEIFIPINKSQIYCDFLCEKSHYLLRLRRREEYEDKRELREAKRKEYEELREAKRKEYEELREAKRKEREEIREAKREAKREKKICHYCGVSLIMLHQHHRGFCSSICSFLYYSRVLGWGSMPPTGPPR